MFNRKVKVGNNIVQIYRKIVTTKSFNLERNNIYYINYITK